MTDTETTEPEAVEPEDNTVDVLRTWGLSGQPSTWAQHTWVPLIETIRAANHGEVDAAAVQSILDATFPDAGYQAADIVLAHPPTGAFTATVTDMSVRVDLVDDADLGLPDENCMWDFGDWDVGGDNLNDAGGADYLYSGPGVYAVRCTIPVGGVLYTTNQDVTVGDVPAAEPAIDPAYAERPATVFSDPDEEPQAPPAEEEYDPGDHTVEEVLAYAAEHPDQADEIAAAEEAGKARVTILDKL